jgi:hypothetical protein
MSFDIATKQPSLFQREEDRERIARLLSGSGSHGAGDQRLGKGNRSLTCHVFHLLKGPDMAWKKLLRLSSTGG